MRKCLQVEVTDDGIFISAMKDIEIPDEELESGNKYWNDWEEMETEEMLFKRIKEII